MNVENFFEYGVHFDNFNREQLVEMLDVEGIEELPDGPIWQLAVEALGQYLVGNWSDPAESFKALDGHDKSCFIDVWFGAIKDPQTLKSMGKYLGNRLI